MGIGDCKMGIDGGRGLVLPLPPVAAAKIPIWRKKKLNPLYIFFCAKWGFWRQPPGDGGNTKAAPSPATKFGRAEFYVKRRREALFVFFVTRYPKPMIARFARLRFARLHLNFRVRHFFFVHPSSSCIRSVNILC